MATNPNPSANSGTPERPLTYEEGWQLLRSVRGILKESYPELGGAEEFHRRERESWNKGSQAG